MLGGCKNSSSFKTSGILWRLSLCRTPEPRTVPEIGFFDVNSQRMAWLNSRPMVFRILALSSTCEGKTPALFLCHVTGQVPSRANSGDISRTTGTPLEGTASLVFSNV